MSDLHNSINFKKEYLNPAPGYTNVVSITTACTRTLYISGQVGEGDTLEEQLQTSFLSLLHQLKNAESEFSDVVKITLYIVDYHQDHLPIIGKVRKEIFGTGVMPAITMLGVASLAFDSMKVETEAVAVMPIK